MIGVDISHHNRYKFADILDKYKKGEYDFIIMKTSEGKTFTDPKYGEYLYQIANFSNKPPLLGFYHYCHPENNQPHEEMAHFLEHVKPVLGKALIILDIEQRALGVKTLDQWTQKAVAYLKAVAKVKPVIYIQQSATYLVKSAYYAGCELWVARYNGKNPRFTPEAYGKVKPWPKPIMWQYTSTPLDMDYFYGNPLDWMKVAALID